MINFNKVTENFSKVYEYRNSQDKRYFLNSSLEIIEDESQKASFFDVIETLQLRKWQLDKGVSETPQQMNKLWLQARHIYDNQPYSIYDQSRFIDIFKISITEGVFQNERKLQSHGISLSFYIEILYLINLIFSAEERLANLAKNTQVPKNLQTYYDFLNKKYAQVMAFQQTREFDALKTLKTNNPLAYLSVFIKEENGKIIESYPELLQLFELAEAIPYQSNKQKVTSKKKKSYNFNPEQIRSQIKMILKKSFQNDSKIEHKFLLATLYSSPKESNTTSEEYKKLIKNKMTSYENVYERIKKVIKYTRTILNGEIQKKSSVLKSVEGLKIIFHSFKAGLFVTKEKEEDHLPLPISELYLIEKTHDAYVEALNTIIETLKRDFTLLKIKHNIINDMIIEDEDGHVALQIPGGKSQYVENKAKKFGRHYIGFTNTEQDIVLTHFPTLYNHSNDMNNPQHKLQIKKELEAVNSIYQVLIKELSKVPLDNLSNKTIFQPSHQYLHLTDALVPSCNSFPTSEEFTSLSLKNPINEFYSSEEIKTLDKLINDFEEARKTIYQKKMDTYCEEYLTQKSTFLEKPGVISEESFVKTFDTTEKEELIFEDKLCLAKEEKSETPPKESDPSSSKIVPLSKEITSQEKKEAVEINKNLLSTGAIPKDKVTQNEKSKKNTLRSLKKLPWVNIDKKIPNFSYHSRVKRWVHDPKRALLDPAYKNLTTTEDHKQRTLFFHSFPQIIDTLLPTNFCSLEKENTNGTLILCYNIPAKIVMLDVEYEGSFCYLIDSNTKTCYHRCFDPKIESAAKVSNFNSSKEYFDKDISIELDEQTQIIRLYDPNVQAEIYI